MTDDVLSRAFQRYLNVTGVNRRAVSSVPGPLCHRQRHGRRRLTEINAFQSVGALPVWALSNAPDRMKWTWEPPKPPSLWPQLPQQEIEPESPMIPKDPPESSGLPKTPKISAPERLDVVKEMVVPGTLSNIGSLAGEGLQVLYNTNFRTGKDFNTRFQSFLRLLQRDIALGQLRGTQVLVVYSLARRLFVRAGRDLPEQLKGASLLPLLSAVIQGLSAAKQLNPGFLTSKPRLWIILLKHLARQEIGEKSAELFALAMGIMPARCRFRTRGAVLNVLHAYFKLWKDSNIHGKPDKRYSSEAPHVLELASLWSGRVDVYSNTIKSDWTRGQVGIAKARMNVATKLHEKSQRFTLKAAHLMSDDRSLGKKVAEALKNHDPRIHRSLFVIATRLLGKPRVRWTRAHYNWLQILARLPSVDHARFKQLLQLFPKRGRAALSHIELCDLLLLHWDSQGLLASKWHTRLYWTKTRGGDDSVAFAALASAINANHHPEQCVVLLWSLWGFVRLRVGAKTLIKQVLSLSESHSLSPGFLQRLAWTSNDVRIALLLHDVLVKRTGKEHNFWWPPFWDKFSAQFSHEWKYPLIDPLAIAEKMLGPNSDGSPLEQKTHTSHGKHDKQRQIAGNKLPTSHKLPIKEARQILRIKSSLKLLTGAPHLVERQKIHYVASFTKFLAKMQGFLTARDLSSLTAVVTLVLDRGDRGSTERLKWYLGVIYEQLGEEACAQVGMTLRRRREANGRRGRDELTSKREELGQGRVSTTIRQKYGGLHQGKAWPLWRYHVPKNRLRTKRLCRLKAKQGSVEHGTTALARPPHVMLKDFHQAEAETCPAREQGCPHDDDILGSRLKDSHQSKIDPSVSF